MYHVTPSLFLHKHINNVYKHGQLLASKCPWQNDSPKKRNAQNPNEFQCQQKIGMIFGLPDLPKTQDVLQQLGFPITSIYNLFHVILVVTSQHPGDRGVVPMVWRGIHYIRWIIHGWPAHSSCLGQLDFPSKKTYQKLTFQTFAPKKVQGEFFLGEFTHHLGWGKWVFGSPSPQTYESILPDARGRCIDLELAAKLASQTSTIAELSHDCQRPAKRGADVSGMGWDSGS